MTHQQPEGLLSAPCHLILAARRPTRLAVLEFLCGVHVRGLVCCLPFYRQALAWQTDCRHQMEADGVHRVVAKVGHGHPGCRRCHRTANGSLGKDWLVGDGCPAARRHKGHVRHHWDSCRSALPVTLKDAPGEAHPAPVTKIRVSASVDLAGWRLHIPFKDAKKGLA